jgi:hypothetical protein
MEWVLAALLYVLGFNGEIGTTNPVPTGPAAQENDSSVRIATGGGGFPPKTN